MRQRSASAARWRHTVLAFAMTAGAVAHTGADAAPAAAGGQRCLGGAPTHSSHYQAIADARSATWGIGDLTSMVDLPDGRRLFLFGDTVYADVRPDGGRAPLARFGNNSAWVQQGRCFRQLDAPSGNRSWIPPLEQDGTVYWPGGAVVVGNRLHVFVTRQRLDNIWGTPHGSAVATFELPSLHLARIANVPFDPQRIFGSGVVHDGGYLYAFGSHLPSCAFCFAGDVYLARVREELLADPAAWEYRAGSRWVRRITDAQPVIPQAASNTNVVPWRNGYLMVTKTFTIVGPDIDAWWAPAPTGPWQHLGLLTQVPVPPPSRRAGYTYLDAFTYMPSIAPVAAIENGGVLLAYNVGSFDERDAVADAYMYGPRFVSVQLPAPPAAGPRPTVPILQSPWEAIVTTDRIGRVHVAGGNVANAVSYTTTAVGVARTITGRGSWVVAEDGGVFSFGDARFFGSTGGIRLNEPIVGMAATPTGRGYWLVARDGGVFSFGDARFFGSTGGMPIPAPVSDLTPTVTGRGYYLVTLNGSVYAFGDARYMGGAPQPPTGFTVGLSVVPGGYRLVDTSGRVHHFGASRGASRVGDGRSPIVAGA